MRTIGKVFCKKTRQPSKKEVMAFLREKGIEFDDKAKLDELIALIPRENV